MRIHGEEKARIGVYVHIPFCLSKCLYCDFASSAAGTHVPEDRYLRCLLKELSFYAGREDLASRSLSSVYIGGGTPSLFSPSAIGRLVEGIRTAFHKDEGDGPEVTLEANPETLSLEKLKGYRQAGVNRLSIGIQSLNDPSLKTLGRTHRGAKGVEAFASAREAGFGNIGVDLISGIPGEDIGGLERSVEGVLRLKPEHISFYGLTIEQGTPFFSMYAEGSGLPSEEEELSIYKRGVSLIRSAGYSHYEISNFALPGFYSVHNQGYWLGRDYLGLGASAHSYFSAPGWGRRWWNDTGIAAYTKGVEEKGAAVAGAEELGKAEAMNEGLMLGLRMLERGVNGAEFRGRFGVSPKEAFGGMDALEKDGYIRSEGEDIFLTEKGMIVSNEVFLRI